ncbi:MAG TPA: hypothetical protein VNE39_01985 [Planctomycetota bacterium]|nr:hypothetical protein [Planctomycetota bacterium]
MRHTGPFGFLVPLLAATTAVAVPVEGPATQAPPKGRPTQAANPGEIPALVARLASEGWQDREKAMRDLIALGDAARPALREARRSHDPEVRWRAAYALSLLDITLEPIESDAARTLYTSAARARAQKGGADAARELYAEVIERFPTSRWAAAARERLAALRAEAARKDQAPPTPEAIEQLVAQLCHPSWSERQTASQRLARLGEAARPALEAAAAGPDPEVAWRARSLLERLQAESSAPKPRAAGDGITLMAEIPGQGLRPRPRPLEPTDLDALVRTLSSGDARDVAHAREVLLNVGKDALAPLLRGLAACDEAAGVEIMDLLRRIAREDLGFDPDRWQTWWRARQGRGKD